MLLSYLFADIQLPFKRKISLIVIIWFALALIAVLAELLHHSINNYLIYKGVFWHVLEQKNLYLQYPSEYEDSNHYGPLFSVLIAPFALLPNWIGVITWVLFNAWFLYYAIRQLPIADRAIKIVFLISLIEFMTSSHNVQFNPMLTAWILLSFTLVKKENDFWAAMFVVAGFYVKIYGVVGLLFFLFSKHKIRFISSTIFWAIVLFALPMLISSPHYIVQCYQDWLSSLMEKNMSNVRIDTMNMQDISVMGMIRRIFGMWDLSNLTVILPAGILLLLPLLRFKLYNNSLFQLYYVCLVLITTVIYSSGAESPTYVIAMVGISLWFVLNMHTKNKGNIVVLIFAIVFTSLSSTDLVPYFVKQHFIRPYALKALPSFIVWLLLIWLVAFKKEAELQSPQLLT